MPLYFFKKLIEIMNYRHSCFYKNKLLFAMDGEQKPFNSRLICAC